MRIVAHLLRRSRGEGEAPPCHGKTAAALAETRTAESRAPWPPRSLSSGAEWWRTTWWPAGPAAVPYRPRVLEEVNSLGKHLATGWLALGWTGRLRLTGLLASLLKRGIAQRHLVLL